MTTIIAEIGQNFRDTNAAHVLIELAKVNGADLVKFQLYDAVKLYGESGHNELTFEQARHLFDYGREAGIEVFFSVFDVERVKWCEEIGVKRYKLAAGTATDEALHKVVHAIDKPKIISFPFGKGRPCAISMNYTDHLFCIPMYPAPLKYYFLADLDFEFKWQGISDHTIGMDLARIAIARDAQVIEKHFAFDHKSGPDAPWSMTPEELKELRRFADAVKECL